jgi:hypothetical protein
MGVLLNVDVLLNGCLLSGCLYGCLAQTPSSELQFQGFDMGVLLNVVVKCCFDMGVLLNIWVSC